MQARCAVSSFLSDDENAVALLVRACERADFSHAPIVERSLVPFFSDVEAEKQAVLDVQRKLASNRSPSRSCRKNNRSGSPASNSSENMKGSRPAKSAKVPPGAHASTPVKAGAIAQPPSSIAACPAIFKSPKPSDLPMPSIALFRRLSTVGISHAVKAIPAAQPIMAAA